MPALSCARAAAPPGGFAKTAGETIENAIKAAETDALKRALVTFGNAFGLALYDREQRNVAALAAPGSHAATPESRRSIRALRHRPNANRSRSARSLQSAAAAAWPRTSATSQSDGRGGHMPVRRHHSRPSPCPQRRRLMRNYLRSTNTTWQSDAPTFSA